MARSAASIRLLVNGQDGTVSDVKISKIAVDTRRTRLIVVSKFKNEKTPNEIHFYFEKTPKVGNWTMSGRSSAIPGCCRSSSNMAGTASNRSGNGAGAARRFPPGTQGACAMTKIVDEPAPPALSIPTDKLGFIIEKAREYDVKEGDADPDSGSNPTDDGNADILEDGAGDSTRQELFDRHPVARRRPAHRADRARLGRPRHLRHRGLQEALDTAQQEHGKRPAHYLMEMPLLADYLEEGLDAFGESVVDMDDTRDTTPDTDTA